MRDGGVLCQQQTRWHWLAYQSRRWLARSCLKVFNSSLNVAIETIGGNAGQYSFKARKQCNSNTYLFGLQKVHWNYFLLILSPTGISCECGQYFLINEQLLGH